MVAEKSVNAKRKRYAQLVNQLSKFDLVLQGTITKRNIVRDDPENQGKQKVLRSLLSMDIEERGAKQSLLTFPKTSTFSIKKPLTITGNWKRLSVKMRILSKQILDTTTVGVKKRKTS